MCKKFAKAWQNHLIYVHFQVLPERLLLPGQRCARDLDHRGRQVRPTPGHDGGPQHHFGWRSDGLAGRV